MVANLHPWTFGWDALVAIGTLSLAAVTVVLGIVAVLGNRTSREALAIAQQEQQASMFPLLESVPVEHGKHREETAPELIDYESLGARTTKAAWRYRDVVDVNGEAGGVFFSVPVRNVGPGIARISATRALSVPDVLWTDGVASRALVPPGEYARLNFRLSGIREEAYAEVFYSDNSGNQPARLRLYVKGERSGEHGEMGYFVRGAAIYQDDTDEPLGVVGDPRVTDPQPTSPVPQRQRHLA
jgi:hypothetical protein